MNWWLQAAKEMGLCGAIGAVVGMLGGLLHTLTSWAVDCIE